MNKNLKAMNREIREGKNLEKNLPMFLSDMAGVYCQYARLQFTLQYPAFYESIRDGEIRLSEDDWEIVGAVNALIPEIMPEEYDGERMEKALALADALRRRMSRRMDVLTSYTDRFLLREYILNRLEYRYKELPEYEGDDEAAREILLEIFNGEDNAVMNEKIRMMLSQLPVRMTKNKFFTFLEDSFDNYKGLDKTAVESYLYMLRSAAGINEPESFEQEGTQAKKLLTKIDAFRYSDMNQEEYEACKELLDEGTSYLNNATDLVIGLQGLINCIYAVLLLQPYAQPEQDGQEEVERSIILAVKEAFEHLSSKKAQNDKIEELDTELAKLEGSIETLLGGIPAYESVLEMIKETHSKLLAPMMLDKLYQRLVMAQRLLDDSTFAELDPEPEMGEADEAYLNEVKKSLTNELSALLEAGGKYQNRALIAAVLKELPVFFSSRSEVMDYVRGSLAGCRDMAEKAASLELFWEAMEVWK